MTGDISIYHEPISLYNVASWKCCNVRGFSIAWYLNTELFNFWFPKHARGSALVAISTARAAVLMTSPREVLCYHMDRCRGCNSVCKNAMYMHTMYRKMRAKLQKTMSSIKEVLSTIAPGYRMTWTWPLRMRRPWRFLLECSLNSF
jgi:hypothetical protein